MRFSTYIFLKSAFVMGCFFLCSCKSETAQDPKAKKNTSVEEAKNVVVNYTISGKTKAILKAPLMLNVQEATPYVEFPQTLHTDFYNENGKIESIMNAKYARYKQFQSVVFLKDSVVVINIEKGDTLRCEELYWDRNRSGSEFYTDKPVKIRTKKEIINGMGMEASQDFKNWHIKQTTGIISVPDSAFPNF
jgi:LPS export ABC transporter protein LptC